MRKIFLTIAAVLVSAGLMADGTGVVSVVDSGAGQFIGLGKPAVTPNATPGTSIPKSVVITKILGSPATAGTATTFELWDSPNGLTYGAGAKKVYKGVIGNTVNANQFVVDFTTAASQSRADDGLVFKYFPTYVNASANTLNATFLWRPWAAGVVRP